MLKKEAKYVGLSRSHGVVVDFSDGGIWGTAFGLVTWSTKMFSRGRQESLVAVETPLEIARKRLAQGEISKEEFGDLRNWLQ